MSKSSLVRRATDFYLILRRVFGMACIAHRNAKM